MGADPRVLMLGMGWSGATHGGLDRYFRELFEQLPEAVGVVTAPAPGAPDSIRVSVDAQQPLPRRLAHYWLVAWRAACAVEVIDAHFALYALAPLLSARLRGQRTVFHFQGPWAEENLAAGDRSRGRLAARRMVERLALHRADAHVVLSAAFRRVLVERYRVAPWNVHVWPPGVALERFTPGDRAQARAGMRIEPTAFAAVCARRLVPRMGIDTLLDAWSLLAEGLPPDSELLIVGDGPLREHLAARAAAAPLAGRVRVLGSVSDAELIDAYRAADVALVPSLSAEGFGLVVLEAAACGTPSIVSDVGGLPEVVAPLDPSLIVPAGDVDGLARCIDAAVKGSLPSRARTRSYAELFDWKEVATRHRALYRGLVEHRRDERTRVVYLDHVARLSGGEIALLRLLPHLQGVNAHVILAEEGPLVERLQRAGISVEVLPMDPGARELRRDTVRLAAPALAAAPTVIAYTVRLARRLRALRPDLVHANSLKAGVYGGLAARVAGVPLLWHVRDRIAEDYLHPSSVRAVRALLRRLPAGVLANSQATLDTLGDIRGNQPRWVIPDSVTAPPARATASAGQTTAGALPKVTLGRPADRDGAGTTFGMLGRIAPWKGQDLFLDAFAAAFPDGEARVRIVGSAMFGEQSYERDLHALVAQRGLADRVEFRGFREDVWAELADLDALVHASITPEPFGQVVIEGMAAGLPVIAPKEGGPATMIDNGRTGLLVAPRDAHALALALRALHEDPAARARLGSAARAAVARYHPDEIAGTLERAYAQMLHDAGPVRAVVAADPAADAPGNAR